MATYLRPKRGKQATANSVLSGTNKLKAGEIFFEVSSAGEGKGQGRLMMGDGVSNYSDLKAFLAFDMNNVQTFSNITSSNTDAITAVINSINPASTLAHNLNRIKLALLNMKAYLKNNTTNCYQVATISSTTSTTYHLSKSLANCRYIYFVLYLTSTSFENVLVPVSVFKTMSTNLYITYNSTYHGFAKYVSNTSITGYIVGGANIAVYVVDYRD